MVVRYDLRRDEMGKGDWGWVRMVGFSVVGFWMDGGGAKKGPYVR